MISQDFKLSLLTNDLLEIFLLIDFGHSLRNFVTNYLDFHFHSFFFTFSLNIFFTMSGDWTFYQGSDYVHILECYRLVFKRRLESFFSLDWWVPAQRVEREQWIFQQLKLDLRIFLVMMLAMILCVHLTDERLLNHSVLFICSGI